MSITRTDICVPTRRTDWNNIIASLIVIAISLAFGYMAVGYGIGSTRQMGAGYFPLALSIIGGVLGVVVLIRTIIAPCPEEQPVDLRRILFVCAAFVVFALGIAPMGLFATIIATTVVGSFAHREARLHESVLLGAGLAVAIWLIFVVLLGLPMRVLPGGF